MQYVAIFSSRVAVLARPQGGSIQNLRTEYFLYGMTQKECNNNYNYDSTKSGQREEKNGGGGKGRKEKGRKRNCHHRDSNPGKLHATPF